MTTTVDIKAILKTETWGWQPEQLPAFAKHDAGVRGRFRIEALIVRQVIRDFLAAGLTLWINHGGEDNPIQIKDDSLESINEMFACDEEDLYLGRLGKLPADGAIRFIYGNDGWDVISDYSLTKKHESLLKGAQAIANLYGD